MNYLLAGYNMVLLPSDKARLVLGYLSEQQCYQAYKEFLISSPHLRELRGMIRQGIQPHEYDWKKNRLSNILDEYNSIECLVCAFHFNPEILKQMHDCNTVLKKVQVLVDCVKDFEDGSSPDNKSRDKISKETPKSPSGMAIKNQIKKKTKNAFRKHNLVTLQKEIPIIVDIPESHHSDDSSDVFSISELSPLSAEKQVPILPGSPKNTGTTQNPGTTEQKKDFLQKSDKSNYSNLENIMEGLDISLYSEVLLERTDMHEKIAENINKMYSVELNKTGEDNCIKNANTSTKSQSSAAQERSCNSPTSIDLLAQLDHVVKNIVNATENEEIFNEIVDDIVTVKVAQEDPISTTSSDETSPHRPTTSTPELASAKCDVLNTSTSPVDKPENSAFNKLNTDIDIEINKSENIQEDSIKYRLRNRTKTTEPNYEKITESFSEPMDVDKKTPQKSNLDLLAMAISNADVSGSLRKLSTVNSNNNSNDNKIVILSNEVVQRNLADYSCVPAVNFVSDNKNDNSGQCMENVTNAMPLNTHFILPNISNGVNNNVFLNAPQYLISNSDTDQSRMYLIGGAPINMPSQINNETSDIVTMPTFIMLPSNASSTPTVPTENPIIQTTRKPRAVILPQREIKRCPRKIIPNIKNYSDLIMISGQNKEPNSTLTAHVNDSENGNNAKTNKQESKSILTLEISVPELKKESKTETVVKNVLNIIDSGDKNLDGMQVSSTKTIQKMERETPELATVQIQKRQSLSTPRRTKSHVRVLDFNTPPKMNCTRKATTSPKLGYIRANPKTVEKSKSSKSIPKKEPIKSLLFRSPRRKVMYLPEENLSGHSGSSAKSTPNKLKGVWSEMNGMKLIMGEYGNENTSKQDDFIKNVEKRKLNASDTKTAVMNKKEEDKMQPNQEEKKHIKIPAKQSKIIRIHPKRGEKYDFKPTLGKNRKYISTTNRLKWDSDLRALVNPLKASVKRQNTKQKKKPETEVNKSDLSNTSLENMEVHAKKLEDALNFNLANNEDVDNNITEDKLAENLSKSPEKKNPECSSVILIKEDSKEILKSLETEKRPNKGFHKKCNNISILSDIKIAPAKTVPNKLPTLNEEDVIICESESSKDTASLVIIDANTDTCTNKKLAEPNIPVQEKDLSKATESYDKAKDINAQICDKSIITKPSVPDMKINISEQNFSLLETPFKCDESMLPKTPRFICSNVVEDTPLVKINRDTDSNSLAKCGIPTPNFPLTPKLLSASTPEAKTDEGDECSSNKKEQSDKSGSNSYYKPDESENINLLTSDKSGHKNDPRPMEIKESEENSRKEIKNEKSLQIDVDNSNSNLSCNTSSSSDSSSDSSNSSSSDTSSCSDDTLTPEKKLPEQHNKEATITDVTNPLNKTNTEPTDYKQPVSSATFKNSLKQDEKTESQSTLAFELNEKRQRILDKVRADLKLNTNKNVSKNSYVPNSIFNRRKARSKIMPSANSSSKQTTKSEQDVLPLKNTKTSRNSVSPRKKVNLEKKETEILSKSDSNLCENAMTIMHSVVTKSDDYPLLHISDDESDQSFIAGLDSDKPHLIEDCAAKSTIEIVSDYNITESNSIEKTSKQSTDELSNEKPQETSTDPANTLARITETTAEFENEQKSLTERTHTSPNQQTSEKVKNLSTEPCTRSDDESPCKDSIRPVIINSSSESIIELFNQPSDESKKSIKNDDNAQFKNAFTENNAQTELKSAFIDQTICEDQLSDEDLLEFSIHEQNVVEHCYENEAICINNKEIINDNDGFDVDTFQVDIGPEGVLTISPLAELINMSPKSQSFKIKKSPNKMKIKKSPLNILYDELDEPLQETKSVENKEVEQISIRTPCANLYQESPPSKYQKTKKTSRANEKGDMAKKSNKSKKSQKVDHHKNKTDPLKKNDGDERSDVVKLPLLSTNSTKDEKARKRKREGENDNLLGKKPKPCNPQELLKNVGLDTLLNVLHGPE